MSAGGRTLRAAALRDLPILPYRRWRPALPGGLLEGGPIFPEAAPGFVHMPLRGGGLWARGPACAPPGTPFAPLPGRFAYGGPCVEHFGHMLGEFVHRLWVLHERPDLTPLFVATARAAALPRYVADWLGLIGARPAAVVTAPSIVEEILLGEPGRLLGCPADPAHGAAFGARLPPALLNPQGEAPRLAILRGHLQTGRCVGEAWIEAALAAEGYRILRPETLPLAAQIAALTGAERIVMAEGSAMHLLDILPPIRAEVAVLARGPGTRLAEHCLGGKVGRLALFRPRFLIGTLDPGHPRSNAIAFLEPRDFLAFLAEQGFAAAPPAGGFLDAPGLLEADLGAYAAHWGRGNRAGAAAEFLARAIAACRAGRPDPVLRAGLAPRRALARPALTRRHPPAKGSAERG